MPKLPVNAIADAACAEFNKVVDGLVMEKLTNLPTLAGVTTSTTEAANSLPTKPDQGHTR